MAIESHSNEIAPTLRTLMNWILICEPMKEETNKEPMICAMRGRADGEWHESEHEQRIECREDGVTNTITGVSKDNKEMGVLETHQSLPFRVRRLTERELFRLMDLSEEDIDKIQAAGISKTQQAKMAGNSICVNVLYHIFRKLYVDTDEENEQLSLF